MTRIEKAVADSLRGSWDEAAVVTATIALHLLDTVGPAGVRAYLDDIIATAPPEIVAEVNVELRKVAK